LVLYDELGIVREVDWGLYKEPVGGDLIVGDYFELKILFEPSVELLTLGYEASKRTLYDPVPTDICRMTVECKSGVEIWIDDNLVIKHASSQRYIQMDLEPGNHVLTMKTPFLGWRPRRFSAEFTCPPGGSRYGYRDVEAVPTGKAGMFQDRLKYQGSVKIQETLPEQFLDQRKLVYHSGKLLQ
jgi:hypothetical protein